MGNRPLIGASWLAAVVSPWTVAPHPNFSRDRIDGPALLALCADYRLGEIERYRGESEVDLVEWESELVGACRDSLIASTQENSIAMLFAMSRRSGIPFGARAAAALFGSVAASELDRQMGAIEVLRELVDFASVDTARNAASDALIRAVLCQQVAFRYYEMRLEEESGLWASRAADYAAQVRSRFERFRVSHGISWSSRQVQIDIRNAVLTYNTELNARLEDIYGNSWVDVVRGRRGWLESWVDRKEARRDREFVRLSFDRAVAGNRERYAIGASDSVQENALGALLLSELSGDAGGALSNREALAVVRLSSESSETWAVSDALRLLRTAENNETLENALAHVRGQGPSSALLRAGSAVLEKQNPNPVTSRRDVMVLSYVAEVLSAQDARRAIREVERYQGSARTEQRDWKSHEVAWRAIANLLPETGLDSSVMLRAVKFLESNSRWGIAVAAPLSALVSRADWNGVSDTTRSRWLSWANDALSGDLRDLARLVLHEIGGAPTADVRTTAVGLAFVAEVIEAFDRDEVVPEADEQKAVDLCVESLTKARSEAVRGRISFGGFDAGAISTALLAYRNSPQLWGEVSNFLVDAAVDPVQRTGALDRMARLPGSVPTAVTSHLREHWPVVSSAKTRERFYSNRPEVPHWAPAIRAGAALGLIDSNYAMSAVSELAGMHSELVRVDAIRSVPFVAVMNGAAEWARTLLIQCSRDSALSVRAESSRSLASIVRARGALSELANARLVDLLRDDGLLIPLYALHGLQRVLSSKGDAIEEGIVSAVRLLAGESPYRTVRSAAKEVLGRVG